MYREENGKRASVINVNESSYRFTLLVHCTDSTWKANKISTKTHLTINLFSSSFSERFCIIMAPLFFRTRLPLEKNERKKGRRKKNTYRFIFPSLPLFRASLRVRCWWRWWSVEALGPKRHPEPQLCSNYHWPNKLPPALPNGSLPPPVTIGRDRRNEKKRRKRKSKEKQRNTAPNSLGRSVAGFDPLNPFDTGSCRVYEFHFMGTIADHRSHVRTFGLSFFLFRSIFCLFVRVSPS